MASLISKERAPCCFRPGTNKDTARKRLRPSGVHVERALHDTLDAFFEGCESHHENGQDGKRKGDAFDEEFVKRDVAVVGSHLKEFAAERNNQGEDIALPGGTVFKDGFLFTRFMTVDS